MYVHKYQNLQCNIMIFYLIPMYKSVQSRYINLYKFIIYFCFIDNYIKILLQKEIVIRDGVMVMCNGNAL